jgi:hypothetical protein
MTKSRGILRPRQRWTEYEDAVLRQHYPTTRTADLAELLNRPVCSVHQHARAMGLLKDPAVVAVWAAKAMANPEHGGRKTQFAKGQSAWNKGVKGVVGVQEACRATQFKPGRPAHEAHNYQPIGSLRVSKDGYLERKVTDDPSVYPARRWTAVHRLVWEAANGPVPTGCLVVFKAGRKTTDVDAITLDAVECITRRENMLRNTYHRYGPEVAKLVQLRGAISRQINKRAKHEQDHQ